MRKACLFLMFSFCVLAHAQIRYTNLTIKDDTLYAFAGHLYTGKAVYEKHFDQYKLNIEFNLLKGRITRQTIAYRDGGKVLASGYYDRTLDFGQVKCVSNNDTLNAWKTYRNRGVFSELFVCPSGGFKVRDTMIAPNIEVEREYYRNGQLKNADTLNGQSIIRTEWDSTGAVRAKAHHMNYIFDRLFGGPVGGFVGFDWRSREMPPVRFIMQQINGDSCHLSISFGGLGGLGTLSWIKGPVFSYFVEYDYDKRSRLGFTSQRYKGICNWRWYNASNLKRKVTMKATVYDKLSPKEQNAIYR